MTFICRTFNFYTPQNDPINSYPSNVRGCNSALNKDKKTLNFLIFTHAALDKSLTAAEVIALHMNKYDFTYNDIDIVQNIYT